jgi:hypothetical protein
VPSVGRFEPALPEPLPLVWGLESDHSQPHGPHRQRVRGAVAFVQAQKVVHAWEQWGVGQESSLRLPDPGPVERSEAANVQNGETVASILRGGRCGKRGRRTRGRVGAPYPH